MFEILLNHDGIISWITTWRFIDHITYRCKLFNWIWLFLLLLLFFTYNDCDHRLQRTKHNQRDVWMSTFQLLFFQSRFKYKPTWDVCQTHLVEMFVVGFDFLLTSDDVHLVGFEKQSFKRMNEKQASEREAYLWSVSDMWRKNQLFIRILD